MSTPTTKAEARAALQAEMDAFAARGGAVNQVAPGEAGAGAPFGRHYDSMTEARVRAMNQLPPRTEGFDPKQTRIAIDKRIAKARRTARAQRRGPR